MNLVETALSYLRAGLCVLPARLTDKRPALPEWKSFQTSFPSEDQIRTWFADAEALCIVTGAVSGHNEMIDFDQRGELFQAWCALIRETSPELLQKLLIESSPSTGYHADYCCETPVTGNIKLAQRKIFVDGPDNVTIKGREYKPREEADGRFGVTITLIETAAKAGCFSAPHHPDTNWCKARSRIFPWLLRKNANSCSKRLGH